MDRSSSKESTLTKPRLRQAMLDLIAQVETEFPFDKPEAQICADSCIGCPKKLMEFMEQEIWSWQDRLDNGEEPTFGDLQKLAKKAHKIYPVLVKNNLI